MKSTIFPIDVETGEIPPGIQMTDEEDRRRRKLFAEKQWDKTIRRKDHVLLGEFYMTTCRKNQFEGLQPQDVARLVFIATFMDYNCVLKNGDNYLTIDDLPDLLEVSKSTFDRLWDKIQGRYIVQSEDGSLTVVDGFLRGRQKGIKEQLTKVFIAMQNWPFPMSPPMRGILHMSMLYRQRGLSMAWVVVGMILMVE